MSGFGGSVKLTGESEYKKALSEISSNLKVLNSEMKSVTSQYDKNDKSAENLSSQNDVLNKKIEEQEKKVSILKDALADSQKETGENSEKTKKWQIELNNAQADLNKLNRELDSNVKTMEEAVDDTKDEADAVEDFGKEAEKSGEKALSLGDIIKANLISDAIKGGLSALAEGIKGVGAKFGEFLALGEETKEMQTNWAKLYSAFGDLEEGSDMANDSIFALTGVLGDAGKATEASMLLSKMSTDCVDLEKNTRILTGVFAKYGDSIPTEGLAEAMSATSAMGSVQGVLADALEWQGVNLDEYNEKLGKMTSAEERAAFIQQSLTDIYGESADAYREQNEALIESNEAQLRYETWLSEIGKYATPLQTDIKNISAKFLMELTPSLDAVMPKLQNLSGAFVGLLNAVLYGGDVESAIAEVSENVVNLVESIKSVLPQVTDMAMSIISTLISVIVDNLPYIAQEGMNLLSALLSGILNTLPSIVPTILSVIELLLNTIVENLPMILEMGIQILVSLIQGLTEMMPTLVPTVIDAVILIAETLVDNIEMLIDAGIELILALSDGLIDALPQLIEKIPIIIKKLIVAITNKLPDIIKMGEKLVIELGGGLIKAIPDLVKKVPELIKTLVKGLEGGLGELKRIGKNLVEGLWNGIKDATGWVLDKIKGFGKSVLDGIKKIFGIHSPSTVFKDEVGKNLALGVGEGFSDTMAEVSADMQSAIPTEFDADISTNMNVAAATSQMSTYDMMVSAFKQALTEVKVVMDDREMGGFVTNTIERVVFA